VFAHKQKKYIYKNYNLQLYLWKYWTAI